MAQRPSGLLFGAWAGGIGTGIPRVFEDGIEVTNLSSTGDGGEAVAGFVSLRGAPGVSFADTAFERIIDSRVGCFPALVRCVGYSR